jgi:thiol-disulfide isomerase/thioredoxin
LLVLVVGLAAGAGEPPVRVAAGEFKLEDINPASRSFGRKLALGDLWTERGLVLQFTASWCAVCRQELPEVGGLAASAPIVFIAADEQAGPENMTIVAGRSALTAPVLYVPDAQTEAVFRHYAYQTLPATYFIDRDGRIRRVHEGAMPAAELSRAIAAELRP